MALWVPAKATSSMRRSHSSTKPLQPASSMFLRSRSGARTARTKDMPPSSSTRENVATPVVPPRARRRGEPARTSVSSPATQDDAPIRSNTHRAQHDQAHGTGPHHQPRPWPAAR